MEIRHRELSHASVNRFTIAENGVIGFRDPAPVAILFEKRDEMVDVVARGFQIEDQRTLAMNGERESGEQRAFHAVRTIASQRDEGRRARLDDSFLVDGNRVEKILNSSRRVEALQDAKLRERCQMCVHGGQYMTPSTAAVAIARMES